MGKTYVFHYEDRLLRSGGRQHAVMIGECAGLLAWGRLTSSTTKIVFCVAAGVSTLS